MPSNRTTHRPWQPSWARPAAAGLTAALVLALLVACSDHTDTSELSPDTYYIVQGNEFAQEDLRVGLISVTDSEAVIQFYAHDAENMDTVQVSEGESVEVGRRTVTIERVDTGTDEGVAVTVDDPESESTPADGGSGSEEESQDAAGESENPMEDPDVFAVRVGHRVNESGLTIGLGSATEDTARLLITGEDVDEQEVELKAGDEVEVGNQTLVAEEVRDGTAYLRFRD